LNYLSLNEEVFFLKKDKMHSETKKTFDVLNLTTDNWHIIQAEIYNDLIEKVRNMDFTDFKKCEQESKL